MKPLSKINYLLIVLILLAIGYIITGQLRFATQSACQLLAAKVVEKIEISVINAYRILKRSPNANHEFETLVLHELDFSRYPAQIAIQHFRPHLQHSSLASRQKRLRELSWNWNIMALSTG